MPRGKDIPPSLPDELRRNLEALRLFAMARRLDAALEKASTLEQGYITFLAGLVEQEILARAETNATNKLAAAKFPAVKTFDDFDWAFQPTLNVQLVKDLMTLHFIRQGRPVLLLGRPGTGKSHIATALGVLAAGRGCSVRFFAASNLLSQLYASLADGSTDRLIGRLARVDLLIIDDLRAVPPHPEYATLLFDLVDARHRKKATIVSSNLSVKAWGEILGNPPLTASLVDRLMEHAHVINIRRGRSYRVEGPDASPDRPAEMAVALDEDSP
jgi:DNA replication protein DnaC